jgi:hypothetical protein
MLMLFLQSDLQLFEQLNQCPICPGTFSKARRIPLPEESKKLDHSTLHKQRMRHGSQSSNSLVPPERLSPRIMPPIPQQSTINAPNISQVESNSLQVTNYGPVASDHGLRPLSPSDSSYPEVVPISPPPWPQSVRPLSPISTATSTKAKESSSFLSLRRFSLNKFKKPTERPPLPTSLTFRFSASGECLLLWRKNSHTINRIELHSRKSTLISTLYTIPPSESDRKMSLKLVQEGNGWIASIMYHKLV